jgi:UDP-N-acetylmuramoyl-tripeptide--D-alanyl-D-alanine ligase
MGISGFEEMRRLSQVAKPDIGVITNIGLCHLENLGSRDGILQAKTEMFENLKPGGIAVLNGDDDKLITKAEVNGKPAVFYGLQDCHGIYATEVINLGFDGMTANIHTPQGTFEAEIHIPGEHNVYNALAATAVALELGLNLEQIKQGLCEAKTIAGRTNVIHTKGMQIIDDCYNANPVSMEAALDVLSHAKGRTIAVLGDMGELGSDEKALHLGVGRCVAEKKIHTLFCAGKLAVEYKNGVETVLAENADRVCEVYYYENREDMIVALQAYVQEGDNVLIKASHFMDFPKVVAALTE